RGEIDALRARLAERQREVERIDEQLKHQHQTAEELRDRLTERQREVEKIDAQLREQVLRAEAAQSDADASRNESVAARAEAALAREELLAVYQSRSWAVTRPLRSLFSLMGGAQPTAGPTLRWGDLARVTPLSRTWGFDRGVPIDRHYVAEFLAYHRDDIRG